MIRRLSGINVILLFIVISWGAFVRALGAGLGCGDDWPLCNDQIIPTNLYLLPVFLEYIHRLIALMVWISVTLLLYIVLKYYRHVKIYVKWSLILFILLYVQIFFGMIVVFYHLNPILSAIHLALATLTFGVSIILYIYSNIVGEGST